MNATPNTYYCHLGAIGWDKPEWVGSFYPEDMPPEWRLSFYNTHFSCVYLPYVLWHRVSVDELARWRDDTLERFRFLLEPPPDGATPEDAARLAALAPKALLAAPREGPAILWLEPGVDLKALAQALQARVAAGESVHVISLSGDYPQLEQMHTLLEVLGY